MEIMDREFCKIFWEDDEFYWAYNGSTGMSGGLLCTWRSSCFIMESCLDRTGALEIKGFWGENKVKCSVVNVYMPCIRTRRYEIFDEWNNIYPLYEDYILCFAGDFNTVRTSCERKGRGMATSFQECDKFNDFISTCGLEELSLRGRKYTWYKEDGSAMSRIDRVLINEIGFENWSSISLSALPRTLSDHCPIFTRNRTIDWGPKPFKVKNSWFLLRDYDNMIEDFWNKTCIQGTAGFIFKEKLKLLKSELRVWDRKNCSTMEHKAEEAKKKISELDMKAEAVDLSAEEIEAAFLLNCKRGKLPFTYLGVTVGTKMYDGRIWETVINKFKSKLSLWKSKNLSIAGRITLINAGRVVRDMGITDAEGEWKWELSWRRDLFEWEKELLTSLFNCINRFLQGPETDPATVRKIREAINNQKEVTVQLINYTKTSKKFWNLFHLQPMRDQKVHRACAEREILNMLDHPFLPALYASFQTKTHICLITDYCPGGELFLLLDRQPTKVLKEDAVSKENNATNVSDDRKPGQKPDLANDDLGQRYTKMKFNQ
ncbi:hypothetical protein ACS0TY_018633 [Phlomoides rotata]